MSQTLPNFITSRKPGIFLLLLCLLFSFQKGTAQHCFPGFHFSAAGNTVAFDDQSTADGTITAYSWDFGDGQTSAEQNPTHTYTGPGTYNVCLTITAHNPNCTETFCHHVVITGPPAGVCHAAFNSHQPDPAQTTIDFTDQSTSDGLIGSWAWDFGDGATSTEQSPSHTYDEPGTYLVCLVITDDDGICTSHICHHVVVHHPPAGVCHAAFSAHQPDLAHYTINFTDQSTSDGTIGSWAWDFGDGSISTEQNPTHTYAAPGTYLVCLTITDDNGICTSHVCHHVVLHHHLVHHSHHALIKMVDDGKGRPGGADGSLFHFEQTIVYPNPVVDALKVVYQLPATAKTKVELYSLMTGVRVAELTESTKPAGEYTEIIGIGNLMPGLYVLKMTVDGMPYVRQITVQ